MSKPSGFDRALTSYFARVNRTRPWHKLPFPLGLFNLIALREELRANNLVDTRTKDDPARTPAVTADTAPYEMRRYRRADGSYNDLSDPDMGKAGTRFARNVPLVDARPDEQPGITNPSPRLISQKLMRREEFIPATSLNLLAAAWIQFQTPEKVDLQIGMHAETPPKGFGFSDTAFRVFILMASRRLKSDRFLTDCYTEEHYTKTGLKWVADNSMITVLLRHFPELGKALDGVPNAFVPWNVSSPR